MGEEDQRNHVKKEEIEATNMISVRTQVAFQRATHSNWLYFDLSSTHYRKTKEVEVKNVTMPERGRGQRNAK